MFEMASEVTSGGGVWWATCSSNFLDYPLHRCLRIVDHRVLRDLVRIGHEQYSSAGEDLHVTKAVPPSLAVGQSEVGV